MGAFQFHAYTHKDPKNFCWFLKGVGRGLMDIDSPLVWEEAKWSSTPSGRQIPHACRVKMRLLHERSVEASCVLQAVSVAETLLSGLIHLY